MNYALIDNTNTVVNVIVWDGTNDWRPPEGLTSILLQGEAGIGWSYIDGQFVPPLEPEPTPEEVTS